jgi:hypothetical protein
MFTACMAFRGLLDGANKSWIQKPVELRIQLLQMGEPASSILIFDAEFLMLAYLFLMLKLCDDVTWLLYASCRI